MSDEEQRGGHLVNFVLCLITFTWIAAFMPEPIVLGTLPGVVAWLVMVERCRTTKSAVLWLFVFGAVAMSIGYAWLAETVHEFGGIGPPLNYVAVAVFGIAGVAHALLFLLLYRSMLARGRRPHPLVTVILFCACEALPIRLFPWMAGNGAIDVPPLAQQAEWGGVSAVSFVLLCLVMPVHEWLRWAFGKPARQSAALATFVIGAAAFGWGMWRHADVRDAEQAATERIRVGITQSGYGSKDKRAEENGHVDRRQSSAAKYIALSHQAAKAGAELIVWPETAITRSVPLTGDPRRTNGFLAASGYADLNELGKDHAFLVGLYERIEPPRDRVFDPLKPFDERYNVAALRQLGDRDAEWSAVRKVYLIPFGEYMPFGVMEDRLPQKFKMRPGADVQEPLRYKDLRIVPFLCYEGILPEHVRNMTKGAYPDLLVSLTNDSWFGDTWEPHQHLNFTRFRAIEHRAPLVRATNTGISAFVSATGEVVSRLPLDFDWKGPGAILVEDVPLVGREPTIYARFGYHFPVLLYVVALLAFVTARMRPPAVTAS